MVPESIFDKHQVYFCELILKFKDENRFQEYDLKVNEQQSQELKVLKEVMTSMPNVKNLQSFFNHEAIQCLWMGVWNNPADDATKKQLRLKRQPPFKLCDDLRDHLNSISEVDRDKIYFFCSKLSVDVNNILPK